MNFIQKIIEALPSLYFLLILVGYELVASLIMPVPSIEDLMTMGSYEDMTTISQRYSIPYRAFSLIVMLGILAFNKRQPSTITVRLFIFYYTLWIIRIFFDCFVRTDIPVGLGPKQFIFVFIGLLSIFVMKNSYNRIDFSKVFKLLIVLNSICVFGMLIRNPVFVLASNEIQGRVDGSIGLNTISTANVAVSLIIMIIYWFVDGNKKTPFYINVVLLIILVVSLIVGLRASSRGPIVSAAIVLVLYLVCRSKVSPIRIVLVAFSCLLLVLFKDVILDFIGYISPVLQERFLDKGESGFQRLDMARLAINGFLEHPVFGYAYGVMFQGKIGYPHNTVLEAFNGLGFFGGMLYLMLIYYALKVSYDLIRNRHCCGWICLIFVLRLVESMFSGCIYDNETLCALWVLVFMIHYNWKKQIKQIRYETN